MLLPVIEQNDDRNRNDTGVEVDAMRWSRSHHDSTSRDALWSLATPNRRSSFAAAGESGPCGRKGATNSKR